MNLRVYLKAQEDILEQASYIAADSQKRAAAFLMEVQNTFRELQEMPHIGAPCRFRKSKHKNIRVWPVLNFQKVLIFYRASKKIIEVIRILHGQRDLPTLL